MHSSTVFLACFGLLLLASPSVALDDDWCGYDPQVDRSTYDYGDSVRAKFIFVDFRDGPYWNFSVMEEELQQAVVDTVKWWLSSMTQHQFEFTADSGIVFHPDDDFTGDGTAAPWRADLRPVQYAVPDSLTTQERKPLMDMMWVEVGADAA